MTDENSVEIHSGIYNKSEIDLEKIIKIMKKKPEIKNAGSILTFSGIVRETSKDGELVKGMKIDAYVELANKSIEKICNEIKSRKGIIDVKLIHFQGDFDISEDLVHIVVASAYREEGFKALRDTVEKYKKKIAVWKREDFLNGKSKWVH